MSDEIALVTSSEEDIEGTSRCCESVCCSNVCGEVKKTVCYSCYNFGNTPSQDRMRYYWRTKHVNAVIAAFLLSLVTACVVITCIMAESIAKNFELLILDASLGGAAIILFGLFIVVTLTTKHPMEGQSDIERDRSDNVSVTTAQTTAGVESQETPPHHGTEPTSTSTEAKTAQPTPSGSELIVQFTNVSDSRENDPDSPITQIAKPGPPPQLTVSAPTEDSDATRLIESSTYETPSAV